MEEKYILSDRGKVYYWIKESNSVFAKNLIFLPGLTANHHLFDFQIQYFSKNHNVLVWDAPAHGKSRPYLDFSYSNLVEELKVILDKQNMKKVVLIGQSAGGFVAQSFIVKYPNMVEGLMMIGTCPYGTDYYSKSDIFWLKQTKWMLKLFPDKFLRNIISKMCGATSEGRRSMLKMLEGYEKKELCHLMYLGFAGFIPEIQDLNIHCPVCLVVGDKDKTGKVRKYNEQWHNKTGYPLHIIKNASHNVNVDKPNELNQIMDIFIKQLNI
ncbi:alpha/beta hydrolase [Clostridioides difficile]|nr:alpha/beta hydrolase [Clostridioides difficile]